MVFFTGLDGRYKKSLKGWKTIPSCYGIISEMKIYIKNGN